MNVPLHSYTNTISAGGGRLLLRPTVINCFEGNREAKHVALRCCFACSR
jgi:hypothetical protein